MNAVVLPKSHPLDFKHASGDAAVEPSRVAGGERVVDCAVEQQIAVPVASAVVQDPLLTELMQPPTVFTASSARPPTANPKAIKRLSYTHDAMIDVLITNPTISQDNLALLFGYSPSWISMVKNSDAFQAKYAERRKEMADPTVLAAVELQFKGIIERGLDILRQKLDVPAADVPDNLVLRAVDLGSRALGYGASKDTQPKVEVNMQIHLEQLAGNLTHLLERKKVEVLEGTALNISKLTSED